MWPAAKVGMTTGGSTRLGAGAICAQTGALNAAHAAPARPIRLRYFTMPPSPRATRAAPCIRVDIV
jgi:hypothetical protein